MQTPGAYLIADRVFADTPDRVDDRASWFPLARETPPDGWCEARRSVWVLWHPDGHRLPRQGWKVHVSVDLPDAAEALAKVRDHCVRHGIAFKFVRSRQLALVHNEKYAHRGSSGKLAALYPVGDDALRSTLTELGAALAGLRGPYVLSDLRWHDGPLFLRFGGFAERYCHDGDEPVTAVETPDGLLVPDERDPVFAVPDWAPVPDFVAERIAAVAEEPVTEQPYQIDEALHHSNGGGVYLATDLRDGTRVVLREARPYAGLNGAGADAVTRLHRERDMLRRLDGLPCVPRVLDHFTWWEHEYLAEELIEGDTLQDAVGARYPLIYPDVPAEELAGYTAWAVDVVDRVERALRQVHDQGVVFGDLHPANVMVRPGGDVVLIDFEQAYGLDEDFTPTLGDAGFTSPRVRRGVGVDDYALACLRLSVFVPLTSLTALCPAKVEELLAVAARFPLPPGYAGRIRDGLRRALATGDPEPSTVDIAAVTRFAWPSPVPADPAPLLASLAEGIRASATPDREDRLFPGDPAQFPHGGATLAHGAAGVIHALVATGSQYPELDEHVDWMLRAAGELPAPFVGLYDGRAGIAAVLHDLGRRDEALELLRSCRAVLGDLHGASLHSGLAGIGLALDRVAGPGDPDVLAIGERLVRALSGDPQAVAFAEPRHPGLLRGWSGPALLLTRLYEHTGDPRHLRAARAALRLDLASCTDDQRGNPQVADGSRLLLYIDEGSAGLAVAAHALLRHGEEPWLRSLIDGVGRALGAEFTMLPGLFHGRAGLLAAAALLDGTARPGTARHVAGHIERLSWHAFAHHGRLAFVGDTLTRLSHDLATGGAGILLAVHAATHGTGVTLPFLPAPAPPQAPVPPVARAASPAAAAEAALATG
ncbi:class III lanthionine synthetase LanKC [Dactylosporangium aurantiacum]|uniref:non-specific serine/threonine protein kinase n=1 Tax=Dactylosporangium aurantiacum TaxID=35754 RepID=A0A9Q9IAR8_9ACTN|nr:class III lanthionine synthetase LanKC [Dactylosporangium aurantiacum]MDG6101865.1 class III lanthionine synthetase LanKC [Dactylosporangium aurantiacum]UWZ52336.1 class III lanthionine synthetase LanKC [Dactylosporangium aurantiacum]